MPDALFLAILAAPTIALLYIGRQLNRIADRLESAAGELNAITADLKQCHQELHNASLHHHRIMNAVTGTQEPKGEQEAEKKRKAQEAIKQAKAAMSKGRAT